MSTTTLPRVEGRSRGHTLTSLRGMSGMFRSALAVGIAAVILLPIFYMLMMSVRSGSEIAAAPLGLPGAFTGRTTSGHLLP
ncbi:hypothetical protein AWV79_17110 [Cupriavidus sp. UYMMa02A]|nr:hypothetical protein AWV79_17110 [Cupriavidus sp. UYMMa02A]